MSDTGSVPADRPAGPLAGARSAAPSTSWLLRGLWGAGAAVCAVAMNMYPARETIPFHLIWIGLSLVYGFAVWRPLELAIMVSITAAVTGAIMVHHAMNGWIDWPETAEVPLSVVLIAVIATHIRRRHLALAELAAVAQVDRRQAEMRQQLMRHISHELRTPITVARGYTELVRERAGDSATAEDTAVVLEELDKLAEITRRLVTLIQIDGRYAREPVNLDTELTRIVRRWTPAADRKWSVGSTAGQVLANRDRLEAALDCLLDNAVKFTDTGDAISVSGTIDRQSWTIEVADAGLGMSADDREPEQGTGLGLSMVRAVVESWDGSMALRDRDGGGTVVVLRFPASPFPERTHAE
jgi:signal transduction histidine kinase